MVPAAPPFAAATASSATGGRPSGKREDAETAKGCRA